MPFEKTEPGEPTRYKISFRTIGPFPSKEKVYFYAVCTMLGERKAVALAVNQHLRNAPDARVYDVNVKSLGEGQPNGNDLVDRLEW
jgi:hypothetical protein